MLGQRTPNKNLCTVIFFFDFCQFPKPVSSNYCGVQQLCTCITLIFLPLLHYSRRECFIWGTWTLKDELSFAFLNLGTAPNNSGRENLPRHDACWPIRIHCLMLKQMLKSGLLMTNQIRKFSVVINITKCSGVFITISSWYIPELVCRYFFNKRTLIDPDVNFPHLQKQQGKSSQVKERNGNRRK